MHQRTPSAHWRLTAPALTFLSLSGLFLGIWFHAGLADRRQLQFQTRMNAELTASWLEDFVGTRLAVVERLADETSAGEITSEQDFVRRARETVERFAGYQAINWVDSDGTIRLVAPAEKNPGIAGRSVAEHPLASPHFQRARDTGHPAITGALDLFQGHRGFASYFPARLGGEEGFANGVFSTEVLVLDLVPARTLEDYLLVLRDGGDTLFTSSPAPVPEGSLPYLSSADLAVADRRWTLEMAPTPSLIAASTSLGRDWFLASGLLAALASAALVRRIVVRGDERRRMAIEQRRLEAQMLQAQKLESLGRLAGGIAHDFNNLLTAVAAGADLALLEPDNQEEITYHMNAILDVVARGARLTRQLLAFSRRELCPEQPVALGELLESSMPLLKRLVREETTLHLAVDSPHWRIRIDPGHAEQVLLNLVTNADDASPAGGEITLSVRNRSTGDGDSVVLEVQDRGQGMSPRVREQIFEPFFTTKAEGQGTGLGLATVASIAQRYGARIEVESEEGAGTTFRLCFPRTLEEATAETHRAEPVELPPATVLLVEDDSAVRTSIGRGLEAAGFDLLLARDGEEALALLSTGAGQPRVDAVVTDLAMPRMGGERLLQAIRQHHPTLPVIVTSGYPVGGLNEETLSALKATFLSKPFRSDQLVRLLAEQLREQAA